MTNICEHSRKVTLRNATPKEVNTPIGQETVGCVSLSTIENGFFS